MSRTYILYGGDAGLPKIPEELTPEEKEVILAERKEFREEMDDLLAKRNVPNWERLIERVEKADKEAIAIHQQAEDGILRYFTYEDVRIKESLIRQAAAKGTDLKRRKAKLRRPFPQFRAEFLFPVVAALLLAGIGLYIVSQPTANTQTPVKVRAK